jgi:DNA-binding NtrC family response regulator
MNHAERDMRLAAGGYSVRKRRQPKPQTVRDATIALILETLDSFGGHRLKAATRLGISKSTIYRYLKQIKAVQK